METSRPKKAGKTNWVLIFVVIMEEGRVLFLTHRKEKKSLVCSGHSSRTHQMSTFVESGRTL